MVLCGVIQLSLGEKLNCNFQYIPFFQLMGPLYSCDATIFDTSNYYLFVTAYTGNHYAVKNNNDVRAIQILSQKTKNIPVNLGTISSLLALRIQNSQLIEIKSQDFHNMRDLEHLSLMYNNLTSLPSDAFNTLPKLREIYLTGNQIEELPFGLFSNNVNLEIVDFMSNKIKFIATGLFDGLVKLNKVFAKENICEMDSFVRIQQTGLQKLKYDIKTNCNASNDLKRSEILKLLDEIK